MTRKEQEITELYLQTIQEISNNKEKWLSFLKSASYSYKYRFDEQVLIYAQKPEATAVAETTVWNKKLKRWINKGSKGIALMTEKNGEIGLKFVFDVSDTNSNMYGRKFKLWTAEQQYHNDIIEALEDKFGTMESKENLLYAIMSTAFNHVAENMQDYLEQLKPVITNSKLDGLSDEELENTFLEVLMYSTVSIILSRCGMKVEDYVQVANLEKITNFNTFETITILGTATRDFSREILLEISKTVINLQKHEKNQNYTFDKNKQQVYDKIINNLKGSVENEYNLQRERQLSNTRIDSTTEQQSRIRQISQNEIEISKREQNRNVRDTSNEQQAERPPSRNRTNSEEQNTTNSRADEETRKYNRRIESTKSDGMDGQNEQYSSDSRTDSNKGTNTSVKEGNIEKGANNASFFDGYNFQTGDIFYIGEKSFTVITANTETISIYNTDFPLDQRTVVIKNIIERIAENPVNDYLKGKRETNEQALEQQEERESTREEKVVNDEVARKITNSIRNRNIEYFDLHPEIPAEERNNFEIKDDLLGVGTTKERFKNNIEAIKVLKRCEEQERYATLEEQEILSKYVGWGGLKSVFEADNNSWSEEYNELKNILTDEEYKKAKASSLTAYYTPPVVIRHIYKALENMGLKQANILEPACRNRKFYWHVTRRIAK